MEITTMQMYWLVTLDSINMGSLFMCAFVMICIFGLIRIVFELGKCPLIAKILMPILAVLFIALFSVCVFLPSTKQMAAIMIVPRLANNEKVQTIGNRVYDLAVEWMEELKPNKKGSEVK